MIKDMYKFIQILILIKKTKEKKRNTIATAAVGGGVLLGNNTRFLKTQQFSISKPSPVSVSEIGFLTSQLGGIRISYNPPKPLTAPFTPAIQPLVARKIFSLSLVFLRSGLIKVLDCDFFFFWIKYHCRTTFGRKARRC
jgi:hypothetical protein